ncbi:MFS transporter [Pseudactinotalea suaedae]|uniref:MFS transporter n=1 Tax=Pseudactinotalea suaedae TaxID=1524924 RepID=UPI0012E1619C|nr:MFS transporter [Pseudactinotalea suaedae]
MTNVPTAAPQDDELAPVPRRVVRAWSLWDFGQQSFNTVILTFVFSVYVTGTVADSELRGTQVFSNTQAWAGLAIALLAPAMGTFADRLRNSRLLLTITTVATIACMAGLWFVKPEDSYLLLGCLLIAVASVFSELAGVFYNSMLLHISTPKTYGRISGTAWGLGYIGGVIALVIALFGFILNGGMLGLPTDEALNVRGVAVMCAIWFLVFGMPLLLLAPKEPPSTLTGRFNLLTAYRDLGRRIVQLWRTERSLLHFFLASAVYRDGLGAVFTFAGVLAANAYGFSTTMVIIFGLAANLVAGIGTWFAGRLDDKLGPRPVIVGSLAVILVMGAGIIVSDADIVFWVGGLVIASCVGPIQSASRSMLARMTSTETASENFGLYATAGRAVSFLAPAAFASFVAITGQERLGIIGIVVVLALGLALFLSMRFTEQAEERRRAQDPTPDRP